MKRIWQYNPEMKLISILRNPIERAYSNWKMEVEKGRETERLSLTLEEEENRCRSALPHQHRIYSYLSRGFYTEQIRRIWQYFPRENCLLIKQEELLTEPEKTLEKIYEHLKTWFEYTKIYKKYEWYLKVFKTNLQVLGVEDITNNQNIITLGDNLTKLKIKKWGKYE